MAGDLLRDGGKSTRRVMRTASETFPPEPVADHSHRRSAVLVFLRCEFTPQSRFCTQHAKEARGNLHDRNVRRRPGTRQSIGVPLVPRHFLKRACGPLPIEEVWIGWLLYFLQMLVPFPNHHQAVRLAERQRSQHDSFHDAEHGGIGPNAQGEGEHRDSSEARRLA